MSARYCVRGADSWVQNSPKYQAVADDHDDDWKNKGYYKVRKHPRKKAVRLFVTTLN